MNEGVHLQARLDAMAARQDRAEANQDRAEAKLDRIESMTADNGRRIDVALADVGARRAHLNKEFQSFRSDQSTLREIVTAQGKDIAEIKMMIHDMNTISRFVRRVGIVGAGALAFYGIGSWSDLQAHLPKWLGGKP